MIGHYSVVTHFSVQGIKKRLRNDSGAQFMEYAMLAALIAVGVSVAVFALKDQLAELFATLAGKVAQ